jgi:hypothetical protein
MKNLFFSAVAASILAAAQLTIWATQVVGNIEDPWQVLSLVAMVAVCTIGAAHVLNAARRQPKAGLAEICVLSGALGYAGCFAIAIAAIVHADWIGRHPGDGVTVAAVTAAAIALWHIAGVIADQSKTQCQTTAR